MKTVSMLGALCQSVQFAKSADKATVNIQVRVGVSVRFSQRFANSESPGMTQCRVRPDWSYLS